MNRPYHHIADLGPREIPPPRNRFEAWVARNDLAVTLGLTPVVIMVLSVLAETVLGGGA